MKIRAVRIGTDGQPEAEPIVDKTLNTLESKLARAHKVLGDGIGLTPCDFVAVYRGNHYKVGDVVQIEDDLGVIKFTQIDSIEPQVSKESDGGLKTTLVLGLLKLPYEPT